MLNRLKKLILGEQQNGRPVGVGNNYLLEYLAGHSSIDVKGAKHHLVYFGNNQEYHVRGVIEGSHGYITITSITSIRKGCVSQLRHIDLEQIAGKYQKRARQKE